MNFDAIFAAYYTLYRAEAVVPASTDDEYTIALRFANEAIDYWEAYDSTYWKELFQTAQVDATGTLTVVTGTKTYAGPTNMREGAGLVKILDANNNTVRTYPIIEPQEAQFKGDNSQYAYFTGNPSSGFTLHLNPAPDSAINGMKIDYTYYKKATRFVTGADTTEMSDPYFIVHRALSNRFRATRNPYYTSAKADAENAVKVMQGNNNSGSWANPWKLQDNSGSQFGM